MSLTPAYDEAEARKRKQAVELCGKNMGSHDYIPIEWLTIENTRRVTRLLCRVCFCNAEVIDLLKNYPKVKI